MVFITIGREYRDRTYTNGVKVQCATFTPTPQERTVYLCCQHFALIDSMPHQLFSTDSLHFSFNRSRRSSISPTCTLTQHPASWNGYGSYPTATTRTKRWGRKRKERNALAGIVPTHDLAINRTSLLWITFWKKERSKTNSENTQQTKTKGGEKKGGYIMWFIMVLPTGFEPVSQPWKGCDLAYSSKGAYVSVVAAHGLEPWSPTAMTVGMLPFTPYRLLSGTPYRTRTRDTEIRNLMLFQLS